jgi:putative nucleotidyltransferase with HDIG domain
VEAPGEASGGKFLHRPFARRGQIEFAGVFDSQGESPDICLHNLSYGRMIDEKQKSGIWRFIRWEWLERGSFVRGTIGVALIAALSLMFPRGESVQLDYKVGAVWAQKDLIAPFSFPILRDERDYLHDVEEARKKVYDVYERDTAGTEAQLSDIGQFFAKVQDGLAIRAALRGGKRGGNAADSASFNKLASSLELPLSDHEWDVLAARAATGKLQNMRVALEDLARGYLQTGILDRPKSSFTRLDLALRKGTVEEIVPSSRLLDKNEVLVLLEQSLLARFPDDKEAVSIAYKIGVTHIHPNIKFNPAATDQALAAAADAVPRTVGFVQENERIVSKHERITQDIKLKLESLRKARAERGTRDDRPSQMVGTVLHVSIIVLLYALYLYLFRKRIFFSSRKLAVVAILIALEGLFAYLTREIDVSAPIEFLILVPVATMLLAIIFDSRVGFYGTVVIAFLVAGIHGSDYTIALASLIAGALAVYTVRDMKNRTQIFRSLGFIFLGYALTVAAVGLERYESLSLVAEKLVYSLVNALLSPVLTYGLLIFFERTFRVTTDLTLMELAHFNHPLLRLLAEKAPGTYQHSLTMASLAESAAVAVGANEVLARVGAYFHDVGKVVKPTYFVENQKSSRNRHEKLSPRMSSLIIAAHVKDGVTLAREYGLPEEVVEFIPTHHGTTRMEFFYSKALELAHSDADKTKIDEIKEQDYRYPGPKPQTKETGIMMLADTIEASVRTLEDPSPQRLEQTIDEFVKKRFEEGELDECPLTLKDLTKIKTAFLGVLVGIYHTRVKYPEVPKAGKGRHASATDTSGERLSSIIREIDNR